MISPYCPKLTPSSDARSVPVNGIVVMPCKYSSTAVPSPLAQLPNISRPATSLSSAAKSWVAFSLVGVLRNPVSKSPCINSSSCSPSSLECECVSPKKCPTSCIITVSMSNPAGPEPVNSESSSGVESINHPNPAASSSKITSKRFDAESNPLFATKEGSTAFKSFIEKLRSLAVIWEVAGSTAFHRENTSLFNLSTSEAVAFTLVVPAPLSPPLTRPPPRNFEMKMVFTAAAVEELFKFSSLSEPCTVTLELSHVYFFDPSAFLVVLTAPLTPAKSTVSSACA